MKAKDAADVLYHVRLAICGARGRAIPYRHNLEHAEQILVACLRGAGHDPGKDATDADRLKLKLIREEVAGR